MRTRPTASFTSTTAVTARPEAAAASDVLLPAMPEAPLAEGEPLAATPCTQPEPLVGSGLLIDRVVRACEWFAHDRVPLCTNDGPLSLNPRAQPFEPLNPLHSPTPPTLVSAAVSEIAPEPEQLTQPTRSQEDQAEVDQMLSLAKKHGFSTTPMRLWQQELGQSIASRMVPRLGASVYQMFAYNIPAIPKEVLEQTLPAACMTEPTNKVTTWSMDSSSLLTGAVSSIMSMSAYVCAGSSKALQTKSQPVIRVVAKLMKPLTISHVVLASGLERTYINGMYALVSEHGEISWPKDSARREIEVEPELEAELREEVLKDMQSLADRGRRLSPQWWRQLGDESKALEEEAELAKPAASSSRAPAVKAPKAPRRKRKAPKRTRFTQEDFEIDSILEEKKVSGKEKVIFLVRWSEYDSSWEPARATGQVGDPMTTWEPLLLVQHTDALREFRRREA